MKIKDFTTREPRSYAKDPYEGAGHEKGNSFPHQQKTQRTKTGRDGGKLQPGGSKKNTHMTGRGGCEQVTDYAVAARAPQSWQNRAGQGRGPLGDYGRVKGREETHCVKRSAAATLCEHRQ